MRKVFLFSLVLSVFLSACSTFKNEDDFSSSTSRLNEWGDVDITNIDETHLSKSFKKSVSPVIYFQFNGVSLSRSAMSILDEQVAWLRAHPLALIVVEGHCDERGTTEYNLALGESRANAVADYFVTHGIDVRRIRVISYGKDRPAEIGSTESVWAKNRRAVTVVK